MIMNDEYEDDFEDDFGREERFDTVELSSFEADEDVFAGYDRRDELTIDDLDDLLWRTAEETWPYRSR